MKELEWGLPHSSFGLWENDTRLTGLELDSNHQSPLCLGLSMLLLGPEDKGACMESS